jgi:hypothetical protein
MATETFDSTVFHASDILVTLTLRVPISSYSVYGILLTARQSSCLEYLLTHELHGPSLFRPSTPNGQSYKRSARARTRPRVREEVKAQSHTVLDHVGHISLTHTRNLPQNRSFGNSRKHRDQQKPSMPWKKRIVEMMIK